MAITTRILTNRSPRQGYSLKPGQTYDAEVGEAYGLVLSFEQIAGVEAEARELQPGQRLAIEND